MNNPFEVGRSKTSNNAKDIRKANSYKSTKATDFDRSYSQSQSSDSQSSESQYKQYKSTDSETFWSDIDAKYNHKYNELFSFLAKLDEHKVPAAIIIVVFTGMFFLAPALFFLRPITEYIFTNYIDKK